MTEGTLREIVLLGAGHTHLHVLRLWREAPIPNTRLTCVSDFLAATYSGMLPGTLAGLYRPEEMQIELVRLCEASGVRLIRAEITGRDAERRELTCKHGPPIPFDVLSIGIGSVPRDAGVETDDTVLRIKPMQSFLRRLDERLASLSAVDADQPLRIAVIGGGAGGVEIALCLPGHLRSVLNGRGCELVLVDRGTRLLAALSRRAGLLARRELQRCGVRVLLGQDVQSVAQGQIVLGDNTTLPCDLALWSTGPQAPPLLSQLGLPNDDSGFLLTRSTLQSTGDDRIFVVGDSGTMQGRRTPKAGVYAVRQGPILWGNLHRTMHGRPLLSYAPQRQHLSLLATGDGRALLSYGGLATSGRWCWRLKDSLDQRFVQQFHS